MQLLGALLFGSLTIPSAPPGRQDPETTELACGPARKACFHNKNIQFISSNFKHSNLKIVEDLRKTLLKMILQSTDVRAGKLQLLKPACREPVLRNKRSHCSEKPSHITREEPLLSGARESPRSNGDPVQLKVNSGNFNNAVLGTVLCIVRERMKKYILVTEELVMY
ncbi:hypothetical protein MJT46_008490 [Ovis ammon polii x Ovis aries]|nr:hypothetical protein MJT46_008490 [Ovis ammon polii x Ovis aries]